MIETRTFVRCDNCGAVSHWGAADSPRVQAAVARREAKRHGWLCRRIGALLDFCPACKSTAPRRSS